MKIYEKIKLERIQTQSDLVAWLAERKNPLVDSKNEFHPEV